MGLEDRPVNEREAIIRMLERWEERARAREREFASYGAPGLVQSFAQAWVAVREAIENDQHLEREGGE